MSVSVGAVFGCIQSNSAQFVEHTNSNIGSVNSYVYNMSSSLGQEVETITSEDTEHFSVYSGTGNSSTLGVISFSYTRYSETSENMYVFMVSECK